MLEGESLPDCRMESSEIPKRQSAILRQARFSPGVMPDLKRGDVLALIGTNTDGIEMPYEHVSLLARPRPRKDGKSRLA